MAVPRVMARVNRIGPNRILRHAAPYVPGYALVVHHGRRSGREYSTPVWAFRTDTGYVVALVYGRESDWVRNVLAEGGCTLLTVGRSVQCGSPHLYVDPDRHHIRPVERAALKGLGVQEFLALQTVWSQAIRGS